MKWLRGRSRQSSSGQPEPPLPPREAPVSRRRTIRCPWFPRRRSPSPTPRARLTHQLVLRGHSGTATLRAVPVLVPFRLEGMATPGTRSTLCPRCVPRSAPPTSSPSSFRIWSPSPGWWCLCHTLLIDDVHVLSEPGGHLEVTGFTVELTESHTSMVALKRSVGTRRSGCVGPGISTASGLRSCCSTRLWIRCPPRSDSSVRASPPYPGPTGSPRIGIVPFT